MAKVEIGKWYLTVSCLNPACGEPISFEVEPAVGGKPQWADIPTKLSLHCPSCGVSGEYHPTAVRRGKALPIH